MLTRHFRRAPLRYKIVMLMMFTSITSVLLSFTILGFSTWLAPAGQVGTSSPTANGLLAEFKPEGENEGVRTIIGSEPISTRKRYFFQAFVQAFAGSLSLAYLLSIRMQACITRPLESLTRITGPQDSSVITTGTSRIVPEKDELWQIGHNVLQMSAQIESGKDALKFAYERMEQEIDERTQDLKDKKEAAEKTARFKSQFLANISHELRTPMHGILSYANFGVKKSDKADREKLNDYFLNIQKAGYVLLDLLNDLLDLAKLEAGKTRFEFKSEGILPVIKDAIDEFHALIEERGLSIRITEATDSLVFMDRKRMLQVARNILNNAIKFSPAGSEIQVRVRQIDGAATIEIRDHGEGVPVEDLDEIFEKFVQAHDENKAGGTGLGLAICKEIIKSHNGDIWVYNHPTGGAVFIFSIPLASTQADQETLDVDGEPVLTLRQNKGRAEEDVPNPATN